MPAWMLDETDRLATQFDVGAFDSMNAGTLTHLVLCNPGELHSVNRHSPPIDAFHMGPPLCTTTKQLEALGTAALDDERGERRKIKVFVDERLFERKAQEERIRNLRGLDRYYAEYVIHPPFREPDEDASLWRFSCVGFVLRAYMEARIQLLDLKCLPPVSLESLKSIYRPMAARLDDQKFREQLGIGEGDNWPVAMAGQVMNSLARNPEDIRREAFVPEKRDEKFPRRHSVKDSPIAD